MLADIVPNFLNERFNANKNVKNAENALFNIKLCFNLNVRTTEQLWVAGLEKAVMFCGWEGNRWPDEVLTVADRDVRLNRRISTVL